MQDALEEIDELKRRKWVAERESRDLNAKLADKTQQCNKLKEDNKRFIKKVTEILEKED